MPIHTSLYKDPNLLSEAVRAPLVECVLRSLVLLTKRCTHMSTSSPTSSTRLITLNIQAEDRAHILPGHHVSMRTAEAKFASSHLSESSCIVDGEWHI